MKVVSFVLLSVLSLGAFSMADEHGHNHEAAVEPAPHGGVLRDAAPYKAELVLNGDNAKVYIYDKDLKPAKLTATTLQGNVQFPKDKKQKPVIFKLNAGAFEAKISGISKVHRYDMHVILKEGGTSTTLDFGIDNIH